MSAMPADTGGLPSIQPAHLVCANKACKKAKDGSASAAKAVMACGRCELVAYCCIECKEKNAEEHKKDCESDLLKADWRPVWIRQHRMPTFLSDEGPKMEYFGTFKYLWGNIPAVDIVKLRENEGVRFERNLDLLLPASGDLRNVIMSIGKLPQEYKHDVSVVLNDKEFDVVARNVILLLIFATVQDADTAADCVLHVFYSAFLTKSHMDILTIMLRPLVQDVCTKTEGKDQEALLAKTWTLKDGVQMRVVLSRRQWLRLLAMTEAPKKIKIGKAKATRDKVVNARAREDYRDRHMLCQIPHMRMGSNKFYADGMLLPFGTPRADFTMPNPTFFQEKDVWPMMDSSDPLAGWSLPDVLDSQRGPARKDAYGALYEYIFNRGREFHGQLAFRKISFELCCTDVRLLKDMIPNKKFDRIEASNICDTGYLGIESTLDAVSPMLKTPEVNDKATILMVFLNAVEEVVMSLGPTSDDEKVFEKVMEYMDKPAQFSSLAPFTSMMAAVSLRDEALNFTIRSMAAKDSARDIDMIFDAYMKRFRFDDVGVTRGVQMKEKNTIVEKWPMRFYFNGPTAKAKKEFARLLSSHHIGHERYVEWKAMRKFVIEESL
ncbi:hypothetical protein RB599_010961 [Gaeumannomyces hyphopodioides]